MIWGSHSSQQLPCFKKLLILSSGNPVGCLHPTFETCIQHSQPIRAEKRTNFDDFPFGVLQKMLRKLLFRCGDSSWQSSGPSCRFLSRFWGFLFFVCFLELLSFVFVKNDFGWLVWLAGALRRDLERNTPALLTMWPTAQPTWKPLKGNQWKLFEILFGCVPAFFDDF